MANTIPKDLFPVTDNDFSDSWARRTYAYAHLFAEVSDSLTPKEEDIHIWRNRALQVRLELSEIGKEAGNEMVLEVANVQYNMKIKETDISPNCIQDVLSIIGDQDWYNDNKRARINQIYMMMYGITRQGFNDWLLNLEKKWLQKMNLTYIGRTGRQDSTYNSRGFIYALLKKIF